MNRHMVVQSHYSKDGESEGGKNGWMEGGREVGREGGWEGRKVGRREEGRTTKTPQLARPNQGNTRTISLT